MSKRRTLTAERLREVLSYDSSAGVFTWKERAGADRATKVWNARFAGKVAGHITRNRRRVIAVDSVLLAASRLAWLYMTSALPANEIDHVNLDCGDDRWSNLRAATHRQNMANVKARRANNLGVKGVYFDRGRNKFVAYCRVAGRTYNLGGFVTLQEAIAAYNKAAAKLHGEFSRPSFDQRDPLCEASDDIVLLVADSPDDTAEAALARSGMTETDIVGKEIVLVHTGIYGDAA